MTDMLEQEDEMAMLLVVLADDLKCLSNELDDEDDPVDDEDE